MKTFRTLLKTELRLSIRGMDMIIFAIAMPLIAVIIIGTIQGNSSFDGSSHSLLTQSFGAISVIAISAGGLMGLPLVVADYRNKKILKRFKTTPISPIMILLVQITIYFLYAVTSLLLNYAVAVIFFDTHIAGSLLLFILIFFITMASMFSIGMMVGGLAPDSKTASMIATLLYFPMILFSGATIPYEIMPTILQNIVNFLPLTQGVKLLKLIFLNAPIGEAFLPLSIMIAITIICSVISIKGFKWE